MTSDGIENSTDYLLDQLHRQGLDVLAVYAVNESDQDFIKVAGAQLSEEIPCSGQLLLVGPATEQFWPSFTSSREYQANEIDALDKWSARIASDLVRDLRTRSESQVHVYYPFGLYETDSTREYAPIIRWATNSGSFYSSPVGMMVHVKQGLLGSCRFVIHLEDELLDAGDYTAPKPCLSCEDKPCLTTCPVKAFASGSYAIKPCLDYLTSGEGCEDACAVRLSCPYNPPKVNPQQTRYHMAAFERSHGVKRQA